MKRGKRCLAALLIVVLVFANAGPMAWAGESGRDGKVLFSIEASDLISEIKEAAAGRFEMGDVEFQTMEGDAELFWETFVENGGVYELEPDIAGGKTNVNLRLFVRLPDLPEDMEEEYEVTGEEDILLLYINKTQDKVSCQTEVRGDYVRRTRPVTLSGYEDFADGNEGDIITEITNPTPPEKQSQGEPGEAEKTEQKDFSENENTYEPADFPAQADEEDGADEPEINKPEMILSEQPDRDFSESDEEIVSEAGEISPEDKADLPDGDENHLADGIELPGDSESLSIDGENPSTDESSLPNDDGNVSTGGEVLPKGEGNASTGGEILPKGEGNASTGGEILPKGEANASTDEINIPKGEVNSPTGEKILPKDDGNLPAGEPDPTNGEMESLKPDLATGGNANGNNGETEAPKPNPATGGNADGNNGNDAGDYKEVSDQTGVDGEATVKLCVIALKQLIPIKDGEVEGNLYRAEDNNEEVVVVVEFPEGTSVPENMKLRVEAIEDADYLEARRHQFASTYGGNGKALDLYRIGFYAESEQEGGNSEINEITEDAGEYRAESYVPEDDEEKESPSEIVTDPEQDLSKDPEATAGEGNMTDPEVTAGEGNGTEPEATAGEGNVTDPEATADERNVAEPEATAGEEDATKPEAAAGEENVTNSGTVTSEEDRSEPEVATDKRNVTEPRVTTDERDSEESEVLPNESGLAEPVAVSQTGNPEEPAQEDPEMAGDLAEAAPRQEISGSSGMITEPDASATIELKAGAEVNGQTGAEAGPGVSVPTEPVSEPEADGPAEPEAGAGDSTPAESLPDPETSSLTESISGTEINDPTEAGSGPGEDTPMVPISDGTINAPTKQEIGPGVNIPAEPISYGEADSPTDPISGSEDTDEEEVGESWFAPCEANVYMRFKDGLEIEDAVCVFRFCEGESIPKELNITGIEETEKNRISILAFKTEATDSAEEVLEFGILKQRKLVHTGGEGTMPYQMAGLPLAIGAGCAILYCDMSEKRRKNLLPIRRRSRKTLFGIRKARQDRVL